MKHSPPPPLIRSSPALANFPTLRRRPTILLLLLILLLALALRFWGLDFGLPYLYHPDEPNKVQIAQRIIKTGDLNPHYFLKPSLFIYTNTLAYVPYYLVGKAVGVFSSTADLAGPRMLGLGIGYTPLPSTFLMARALTALMGFGTVALTFLVGRAATGSNLVGLVAAAFTAVSPTNVDNSHYITANTYVTFFLMLCLLGSIGILRHGTLKYYVLAGIAAGLTASSKYNGGLVIIVPLLAHFLRHGLEGWRLKPLYYTLMLSAAAFLATTPYALLDYPKFLEDMFFEATHYSTGHTGMEGNALTWYLRFLWQVEGPIVVFALLAAIGLLYTRTRPLLVVAAFPVAYFLFISSMAVRNGRTILPLLPPLFVLAAVALVALLGWAAKRFRARGATWLLLFAVLLGGLLFLPLRRSVANTASLNQVDSRETARVWLEDSLPPGARVWLESYSPYLDPARFDVESKIVPPHTAVDWYQEQGYDYAVFSENSYGRFFREPAKYEEEIAAYQRLFASMDEVRIFDDGDYEVRIYAVPPPAP